MMRRPSLLQELDMFERTTTARRRLVRIVLLVLVTGCGDKGSTADSAGADSSGADSSGAVATDSTRRVAAASDDDTPPGEISESLGSIASEVLRAHIDNLKFREEGKGESGERDCDGADHSLECQLEITPVAGVRKFDADKLTGHGAVIARVRNVGSRREKRLDIKPGVDYYWLVMTGIVGPRSYLFELTGAKPKIVAELPFTVCKTDQTHPQPPHGQTAADFKCCGKCPDHFVAHKEARPQYEEHTAPPWTTCDLGCCSAGT
jgi:hypothetical protein